MLHSVMRDSMSMASTTGPAYSTAVPRAALTPMRRIRASATSLALTHSDKLPSSQMRICRGFSMAITWVLSTCTSSVVPQPKARQPMAPTVEAWLSGQARVRPGRAMPSSGVTTCTMPCSGSFTSSTFTPWREPASSVA